MTPFSPPPAAERPALPGPALLLACAALAGPTLLAHNVAPSSTFYNQALALALWALWMAWVGPAAPGRGIAPLLAALALLAGAVLWSWGPGALPSSLALSSLALLAAAALMLAAGAGCRARADALALFTALCIGLALTGLLNVLLALLQVFAPQWADARWLAQPGTPGRAIGNLRQPNHLSSMLSWACIATVALLELRRLSLRWAALLGAALVASIVLTASRTGGLSVLGLALWGLLDTRLQRRTRALLLAAPLAYAAAWGGMAAWAQVSEQAFGGAARLAETDISGSRFGIWANALALMMAQPWSGVGWGEFNLAWTLTPFPGRPTAFFDHTHNLPLQLLVELGLPLGGTVLALLAWALWRAARLAWGREGESAGPGLHLAQRAALMLLLMIGLHSLLEYPLWYAYFLLPAAWLLGFALAPCGAQPAGPAAARPARWLAALALAMLLASGYSVADFERVARIFAAQPGAAPLAQRIESGQRSLFFAHHADYAAATLAEPSAHGVPESFDRAVHHLLDTRLMRHWAEALHAAGEEEKAQHLAARLREFRKPEAQDFFAACADEPPPAFPCREPAAAVPWRAFLAP